MTPEEAAQLAKTASRDPAMALGDLPRLVESLPDAEWQPPLAESHQDAATAIHAIAGEFPELVVAHSDAIFQAVQAVIDASFASLDSPPAAGASPTDFARTLTVTLEELAAEGHAAKLLTPAALSTINETLATAPPSVAGPLTHILADCITAGCADQVTDSIELAHLEPLLEGSETHAATGAAIVCARLAEAGSDDQVLAAIDLQSLAAPLLLDGPPAQASAALALTNLLQAGHAEASFQQSSFRILNSRWPRRTRK